MLHPFVATFWTTAALSRSCLVVVFGICLGVTAPVAAEPPSASINGRVAAAPGETFKLTLTGKGLSGETRLWTTFGDPIPPSPVPPENGKTDGTCTYDILIPAGTPLGIHGVRVLSANGVSPTIPFVVDDIPTVGKVVGNQTFAKAQELKLPAGVDGRVENLTRDYYRFHVTAGQTVSFETYCRRLGSAMDASLYLYDAKGRILAYCDDAEGMSSDPQFVYSFAKEGDYVLELRDIRYQGGDNFAYHLRIGDFPCIHSPFPLAVKRGSLTRLDFAGISCEDASPAMVNVPADWKENWFPVSTRRASGQASALTTVAVVDRDEIVDREPNNNQPQAQEILLGPGINGRFDAPGDLDLFAFQATKGARYLFAGFTREVGAPADLTFRLLNGAGKAIAAADDNGTTEGILDVTFPADGKYALEVTDLNKRGGPQYAYRIVPTLYRAGFTLTANADTLNIPSGGSALITVTAARRDYAGPIEVSVAGLPGGLSAGPAFLGTGVNQIAMAVSAGQSAVPQSLGNVVVTGKATIQDASFETVALLSEALRARWNGVTQLTPRFLQTVAVAVTPAQGVALRYEPSEIVFGKNLKATVKVIAVREAGFDGPIKLATSPEKDGLPPNVVIELKPLEKGQTETLLTLSANENANPGPFSIAISGTHEKDKVATIARAGNLTLRLSDAFQIAVTPTAAPVLVRGAQLKFKIAVVRNPAYVGDVRLSCEKLPTGVTAADAVLKADQSEIELVLMAATDAAPVPSSQVVLRASSPAEAKINSAAPLPSFSVQ